MADSRNRGTDRCDKAKVIYLPDNHRLTVINFKRKTWFSGKRRYQLIGYLKPLLQLCLGL